MRVKWTVLCKMTKNVFLFQKLFLWEKEAILKEMKLTCIENWYLRTLKFVSRSIQKLRESLSEDKFEPLKKVYGENYKLMKQKGIFPYEFLDGSSSLSQGVILQGRRQTE